MKKIGKYEIIEEIGRGGFAVVYKARDPDLDRVVALKVLAPHLTWDPTFAERFRHEAQTTARLRHPHIITIHKVGQDGDQLYIAMECLLGRTLKDLLKAEGTMPLERALPILEQVADALDYAHGQGAIHWDVKPSNIMVEEIAQGLRVTLMNFGLVKSMESSESLTSAGTILGSPEYMAPEQADPGGKTEIGPATDYYALGVVAYEMLTGQVPFPGDTPGTLNAHLNLTPPDPQTIRLDLPRGIAQVLLTALSKSPRARYPTATAMAEALRPEKEGQGKPPSVWGWVAVVVLGLLLLTSSLYGLLTGFKGLPLLTTTSISTLTSTSVLPTATSTHVPLTPMPRAGTTRIREKDNAVEVYVPAGVFLMGDDKREVYLDGFWIDRTPVTNAQYARFVADTGHAAPGYWKGETPPQEIIDHPVVVSWRDAAAYAKWAGGRLPAEEEWEKAARGTDGREYPWGDEFDSSLCNSSESGIGATTPVGRYSPGGDSPYGVADMAGNVWEWTSSWTGEHYALNVLRGGSFYRYRGNAHCAYRSEVDPYGGWDYVGFRVVVSPISPSSGIGHSAL